MTNENSGKTGGVSLGNFINIKTNSEIDDKIKFKDFIITDQTYMHEYGHYIDSQKFGLAYLPSIGLCSGWSALFSSKKNIIRYKGKIVGNPNSYKAHDVLWTETRANANASVYFKNYYSLKSWNESKYPLINPFK